MALSRLPPLSKIFSVRCEPSRSYPLLSSRDRPSLCALPYPPRWRTGTRKSGTHRPVYGREKPRKRYHLKVNCCRVPGHSSPQAELLQQRIVLFNVWMVRGSRHYWGWKGRRVIARGQGQQLLWATVQLAYLVDFKSRLATRLVGLLVILRGLMFSIGCFVSS